MSYYTPVPVNRKTRSGRTWLWAALTFLLCSVVFVVLLALAASGGALPELRAETSWTPAATQPAADVADDAAADSAAHAPAAGLAAGVAVMNVSAGPVNLRQSPGFQNKSASDVVAVIAAGEAGEIIGGPESADGLVWWWVRFASASGWMAERSSRGVVLLDRVP